ncbi:MAG: hypothetical protein ACK452_08695 [Bacteroidota bacterium]
MILGLEFYNYLLIHYKFDFKKLFSIYLNGIIICSYIGFIQLVSYRVGFSPGYQYYWLFNKWGIHPGSVFGLRLNSIFSEPSQFALMLLPAVFIAVEHFFSRNFLIMSFRNCIVVSVALILTTSSTGYLGIFCVFVIMAINYGRVSYLFYLSVLSVLAYFALYRWVDDFRIRVDTSINLWTKDVFTIEDINSSSFVLYNNVNVMKKSFSDHPFIGRGIGSYELAYQKYSLTKEDDFLIKKGFDFNSKDGNSLYIRSIVEMGSIGLLFWPVFIRRFFIRKNSFQDESTAYDVTWIYSGAVLTLILGYLLRQGNYFLNGFPFFVLLYYFINKEFVNDNPILIADSSTDE